MFPAGDPYRKTVFATYARACDGANSWKAGRGMADCALMFAPIEPELARSIVQSMREGPYKRCATRELAAGRSIQCRSYF